MTEFKQIIGRGTRVRSDYGKLWFSILDYTGSATQLFADPDFDGDPIEKPTETRIDQPIYVPELDVEQKTAESIGTPIPDKQDLLSSKYYVNGGSIEIAAHIVYELDANGKRLRVIKFTDYVSEQIKKMWPSAAELRSHWDKSNEREVILDTLSKHGITFEELVKNTGQSDADPFDLLCHIAFSAPLRTRRERAEQLQKGRPDFWDSFKPEARLILSEILDKYIDYGITQFTIPDILKVQPLSNHGNIIEIANIFGGPIQLRSAVSELQSLLYAA